MPQKVLVFGDSLTTGLEFEDSFEFMYHLESYPGFLARDMEELLKISLKEDKYDFVVCVLGINDLGHGHTTKETVDSLLLLHQLIREAGACVVAVYLHSNYNAFNEFYSEASLDDVCFCDFFYNLKENDLADDEFHLSLQGKQHFMECLQDCIENIVQ